MKRLFFIFPVLFLTACGSAVGTVPAPEAPTLTSASVPANTETATPFLVPMSGENVRIGFDVRGWT